MSQQTSKSSDDDGWGIVIAGVLCFALTGLLCYLG